MSSIESSEKPSKFGLYATMGVSALAIGFSVVAIPFLTPALRKHALPYIPATPKQIKNVFKAVKAFSRANGLTHLHPSLNTSNQRIKLIDLGSGDGRIVFEAASRGYQATGVEINLVLVLYSKLKALKLWPQFKQQQIPRPVFQRANFWHVKMSEYDLIVVFGVQEMMKDLATKLKAEMKPNSIIVSCRNPIPTYKSVFNLEDDLDSVWIYNIDSLKHQVETDEKLNLKNSKPNDDDDDD